MGQLRQLLKRMYSDQGEAAIGGHLQDVYGAGIVSASKLDAGVYRIDRGKKHSWVARVFMPERTRERADEDAAALSHLASVGLDVERPAVPNPVSMLDGHPVLVTEFVSGKPPGNAQWVLREIGNTLGRLHSLPLEQLPSRAGGSLHHIPAFEGLPSEDIRLAASVLDDIKQQVPDSSRSSYEQLRELVSNVDICSDLPIAFIHPDPASVNLFATDDRRVVFVDWTGCGVGPRITCLAQVVGLCWTRGAWNLDKMQTLADAYCAHVQLTTDEIDRVWDARHLRIVWLAAWNFWTRTLGGNPPKGDEWWLLRALAPKSANLIDAVSHTFGEC